MPFIIKIEPEAENDIQKGIYWYNKQQPGLGREFHSAVKKHLQKLVENPFYQLRYDRVHCLPVKEFPYMIHYTINKKEQRVVVHAIFNTSRNPKIWKDRF